MCEYVDLEAINALGILEYDEVSGLLRRDVRASASSTSRRATARCWSSWTRSRIDDSARSTLMAPTSGWAACRPTSAARTCRSRPPIRAHSTFSVTLPDDGLEPREITVPVAELVVAAIE